MGDTQQQVGACPTNMNQDRGKILPDADCAQVMRVKHMQSDLWRGAQQKGQQCRQLDNDTLARCGRAQGAEDL